MKESKKPADPLLAALDERRNKVVRSSLSRWLRENHDALLTRLGGGPVDWQEVAELFGRFGLTNRNGEPPSPAAARKAWFRIRRTVQLERTRRSSKNEPPANVTFHPQASEHAGSEPTTEAGEPAPAPDEFGFARIRGARTAPPATSKRAGPAASAHPRRDPDEVIARQLARRKPGAIPMPTPIEPEDE